MSSGRKSYAYRKSKGAYRAELKAPFDQNAGGLNMHSLLHQIETTQGEQGLRTFYNEVCRARPALLETLEAQGHLHWHTLDLAPAIAAEFPNWR